MHDFSDIFVPGGFPEYTYNPRSALRLEEKLSEVSRNLCKLAIVTGHTKSGKTVLARKVLPRENAVWIDGGSVGSEEDFWSLIIEQLELVQTIAAQRVSENQVSVSSKGSGQLSFPFVGKAGIELSGTVAKKAGVARTGTRTVSGRISALTGLQKKRRRSSSMTFTTCPRSCKGRSLELLSARFLMGFL